MTSNFDQWLTALRRLPSNGKEHDPIIKVFQALLEYLVQNRWQGASPHIASTVFMVLVRELDVQAKLFMGQCALEDVVFDHSWVEIRGQVYDPAISHPVLLERQIPPRFAGKVVDGDGMPEVRYGVKVRPNLELEAQLILETPFSKYMENFSEYRQGLWEIVKEVGKKAGLKLNVEKLRKKHADIRWQAAN
jgi:hypothetical protein